MEKLEKRLKIRKIAPVRLVIALVCLISVIVVSIMRSSDEAMLRLYNGVTHPYHVFMSKLCSHVNFSVAELVYAVAIIGLAAYLVYSIWRLVARPEKLWQAYRLLLTAVMAALVFWAGLTVMWTPCYYAPSFSEQSGVDDGPVEYEELETVTRWFAQLASEYAEEVERDENGACTTDRGSVLDRAAEVFEGAAEAYPFLDGAPLRPKVSFSP